MYCGACFRDNALVGSFRRMGHSATLLPLYLPMTLDEPDQTRGAPILFGGINVYLEDKSALFRRLPRFLTKWLDAPKLLKWTGKFASRTRPEDVGDLTVSMLKGEDGNQAQELDQLLSWLETQGRPDVINISNVLLIGLVRRLRKELDIPVVATLQGEDFFLDALPSHNSKEAWEVLRERAQDVDQFIAPSRYFGELMQDRIKFDSEKLAVIPNGISLEGYDLTSAPTDPPVLGFFARMCEDKGLAMLVESFVLLKQREETKNLRLKIGGGLGPSDEPLVQSIKERLEKFGILGSVEFCPNLSREEKVAFFRSLTVFSAPALYGETFGLYVIEALAAGVPVVQPRHAAFPEIVEATGGGILVEPGSAEALADGIESLIADPKRARSLGETGRDRVGKQNSVDVMAEQIVDVYRRAIKTSSRSKGGDS
ncbi:MAG: glycosyltransferase family 4 protein [Verrucomicrobia bacterium]|nr:glycosyltransferase family 4 protein [Verrucomicrobiota bacterium]